MHLILTNLIGCIFRILIPLNFNYYANEKMKIFSLFFLPDILTVQYCVELGYEMPSYQIKIVL